jgi:preprotein translocase subunit SecG
LFTIWVVFHVIVCIALVLVVLMQSAKGDGLAGTAFSGGVSGAVFGGRGAASFLSRATTVLAVVFMVNCGALAFMSAESRQTSDFSDAGESTVTRKMAEEQERAVQQQAAAQEAVRQDSLRQQGLEVQPIRATPADTGGN